MPSLRFIALANHVAHTTAFSPTLTIFRCPDDHWFNVYNKECSQFASARVQLISGSSATTSGTVPPLLGQQIVLESGTALELVSVPAQGSSSGWWGWTAAFLAKTTTVDVGGVVCDTLILLQNTTVLCSFATASAAHLTGSKSTGRAILTIKRQGLGATVFVTTATVRVERTCAAGLRQDPDDPSECNACLNGTYSNRAGRKDCLPVDPGHQVVFDINTTATGVGRLRINQTVCGAGHFSAGKGDHCVPCEAGKAQPKPGQASCDACVTGNYASEESLPKCLGCPVGHSCASPQSDPTPCEAGKAQPAPAKSSCNACQADTFTSTINASFCSVCPALVNPITNHTATAINLCPKGELSLQLLQQGLEGSSVYFNASGLDTSVVPIVYACNLPELEPSCRISVLDIDSDEGMLASNGTTSSSGRVRVVSWCANNRTGRLCHACQPPMKEVGQRCLLCEPSNPWLVTAAVAQVMVAVLAVLAGFNNLLTWKGKAVAGNGKVKSRAGPILQSLTFDWLQNMGILFMFRFHWPFGPQAVLSVTKRISSLGVAGVSCFTSVSYANGLLMSTFAFVALAIAFALFVVAVFMADRVPRHDRFVRVCFPATVRGLGDWLVAHEYNRSVPRALYFMFKLTFPGMVQAGAEPFPVCACRWQGLGQG